MPAPNPKVRVNREYPVEYPNPIKVSSGEWISLGREDLEFPGWRWSKAQDGREGWVLVELLLQKGSHAIVLQDYSAQELAVRPGGMVRVDEVRHRWLLVRNQRGERGWIPESHTESLAEG